MAVTRMHHVEVVRAAIEATPPTWARTACREMDQVVQIDRGPMRGHLIGPSLPDELKEMLIEGPPPLSTTNGRAALAGS